MYYPRQLPEITGYVLSTYLRLEMVDQSSAYEIDGSLMEEGCTSNDMKDSRD